MTNPIRIPRHHTRQMIGLRPPAVAWETSDLILATQVVDAFMRGEPKRIDVDGVMHLAVGGVEVRAGELWRITLEPNTDDRNRVPWCTRRDSVCISEYGMDCPNYVCRNEHPHDTVCGPDGKPTLRMYQAPAGMPWLSRSYPFLSIARHFGVPYADVLRLADLFERYAYMKPRTPMACVIRDVVSREADRKAGKLGPLEAGR